MGDTYREEVEEMGRRGRRRAMRYRRRRPRPRWAAGMPISLAVVLALMVIAALGRILRWFR